MLPAQTVHVCPLNWYGWATLFQRCCEDGEARGLLAAPSSHACSRVSHKQKTHRRQRALHPVARLCLRSNELSGH